MHGLEKKTRRENLDVILIIVLFQTYLDIFQTVKYSRILIRMSKFSMCFVLCTTSLIVQQLLEINFA